MMSLMLLLFLTAAPLSAQTLSVVHKKDFWRDGRGTIEITKEAVIYQARKKTDSRKWTYSDIRHFDRISEQEFVLLTYEDQNLFLGRDRRYHFAITEGRLNDSLFHKISLWLGKPVTNRVLRRIEGVQYEIPVKHLHPWDGCEGKLRFTVDRVYYLADEKNVASGCWREMFTLYGQWIDSIWRSTLTKAGGMNSVGHEPTNFNSNNRWIAFSIAT